MIYDQSSQCYVVFCYRSVEYVRFLIASLYRESDLFIVHCDEKAPSDLRAYVDAVSTVYPNVICIPSRAYSWAGYSHVAISLDAIAVALTQQQSWTHLLFISEQHLPLKSPVKIAERLERSGSVVALQPVARMPDISRCDIENRFASRFRELPGVGAFAIGVAERPADFIETVYHGSNWLVASREHCIMLTTARQEGLFKPFEYAVHAEENAIQTILAPHMRLDDLRDLVVVAWPHLTDNNDLVMSEELFKSSVGSDNLFIRKRPKGLSPFVRQSITSIHFRDDLYNLPFVPRRDDGSKAVELSKLVSEAIVACCLQKHPGQFQVRRFGSGLPTESPKLHIELALAERPTLAVVILSENLRDYRVGIVDHSVSYQGVFSPASVKNGYLYSTLRVRVFNLFGERDILPLSVGSGAFSTISTPEDVRSICELVVLMLGHAKHLQVIEGL
jgi:hypothetical protein